MHRSILTCAAIVVAATLTGSALGEDRPLTQEPMTAQPPATQPTDRGGADASTAGGQIGATADTGDVTGTPGAGHTGTAGRDHTAPSHTPNQPDEGTAAQGAMEDDPAMDRARTAGDRGEHDAAARDSVQRDRSSPDRSRDNIRDRSDRSQDGMRAEGEIDTDEARTASARESDKQDRQHERDKDSGRIGSDKPHLQVDNPDKPHLSDKPHGDDRQ